MDTTRRPPKRQSTFLVRCWVLQGGAQRYLVRHVQSGSEVQTDSLEAVLHWMEQFRPRAPNSG